MGDTVTGFIAESHRESVIAKQSFHGGGKRSDVSCGAD